MSKPVITSTSGTLIIEDPSDDEMEEDDVEYSPPLVTRHESFDNIPSIYDAFKSKQQVHTNKNFTNQSSLSAFLSPDYCNGVAVSYDNQTLATNASFIEPFPSSSYDDRVVIVLDLANIGHAYGSIGSVDDTEGIFSIEGVIKAFELFREVKVPCFIAAFIPSGYVRSKPRDGSKGNAKMLTEEIDNLEMMVRAARIAIVPTGDHDDAYILAYARTHDGYIVSNDLFNDHISKMRRRDAQLGAELADYLNEYRCGYSFVHGEFMLSPDSDLAVRIKTDLVYFSSSVISNIAEEEFASCESILSSTHSIQYSTTNTTTTTTTTTTTGNLEQVNLVSNHNWIGHLSNDTYLTAFDHLIATAKNQQLWSELTYLLLARAHAFTRLGSPSLAQIDLNFILENIDGNCIAARDLLNRVRTEDTDI